MRILNPSLLDIQTACALSTTLMFTMCCSSKILLAFLLICKHIPRKPPLSQAEIIKAPRLTTPLVQQGVSMGSLKPGDEIIHSLALDVMTTYVVADVLLRCLVATGNRPPGQPTPTVARVQLLRRLLDHSWFLRRHKEKWCCQAELLSRKAFLSLVFSQQPVLG